MFSEVFSKYILWSNFKILKMPSKKKKYNARFPAGRIKKIMQSDEEVGKVAQAVPIIISRTLELFVESLLKKTLRITYSRNAKTLSTSHMKQCIMSESRFDFLRELVKNIPDISVSEEAVMENVVQTPPSSSDDQPYDLSKPSTSCRVIVQPSPTNGSSSSSPSSTTTSNCVQISQQQLQNLQQSITNANILSSNIPNITTASKMSPTNGSSSSSPSSTTTSNCVQVSQQQLQNLQHQLHQSITNANILSSNIPNITTASKMSAQDHRTVLKRQWDSVHESRQKSDRMSLSSNNISANFYKESSVIQHTSDSVESIPPPPKLSRMDSAPPKLQYPNINIVSSTKNSSRRLQHQSKSIPCTSKEAKQNPPPVVPPIINIDICNTPIVKIDYSNLALPDVEQADSCSSSANKIYSSSSSSSTGAASTCISPVINIDLSKITTTATTTNSVSDIIKISAITPTKTIKDSNLEMDEDYDNI